MKLKVYSHNINFFSNPIYVYVIYWSMFGKIHAIKYLAIYLNINEDELKKILNIYNASFYSNEYYFFNKNEDAEKFLNSSELEPYLIMIELCGE